MACALVELDVSLTRCEAWASRCLGVAAVACAGMATHLHVLHDMHCDVLVRAACCCQCGKLLFAMTRLQAETQLFGVVLPVRFRAAIYQDIFGRIGKSDCVEAESGDRDKTETPLIPCPRGVAEEPRNDVQRNASWGFERLRARVETLQANPIQRFMGAFERNRVASLANRFRRLEGLHTKGQVGVPPPRGQLKQQLVQLHGYSDFGTETTFLVNADSGEPSHAISDRSIASIWSISEVERACNDLSDVQDARTCRMYSHDFQGSKAGTFGKRGGTSFANPRMKDADPSLSRSFLEDPPKWNEVQVGCSSSCYLPREKARKTVNSLPQDFYDFYATFPDSLHDDGLDDERSLDSDNLNSGQTPWILFRAGTLTLVGLWALTFVLSFAIISAFLLRISSSFSFGMDEQVLETLLGGEIFHIRWPGYLGFVPRSLSCTGSGTHLLLTDDISMFVVQNPWANAASATLSFPHESNEKAARPSGALRGGATVISSPDTDQFTSEMFVESLHCGALEGEAIVDVDVVCPQETEDSALPCKVLTVHSHGKKICECPLHIDLSKDVARAPNIAFATQRWNVSVDWLHTDSAEEITSVIMSPPFAFAEDLPDDSCGHGCLIVGTSLGRLLQLRPSISKNDELVPNRIVTQVKHAVSHGSLGTFQESLLLLLQSHLGVLQALDVHLGTVLGQWPLPKGLKWIAVCGARNSLFLLAKRGDRLSSAVMELWHFPAPDKLKQLVADQRDRATRAEQPGRAYILQSATAHEVGHEM
eukprot:TRINITY_DN33810_c0_g1_i2.p1 TRINITY_DN33810_c0_g1~~TRINITY_DN33810_c0_g1_i2.p1  ORF type:complete len:878 (+),score=80.33 TRINITY_DN33810_c0_g1_i2:346-2634(+)